MKAAITRQEIKKMERTAERGRWVGLIKLGDIPAFARGYGALVYFLMFQGG